MSISVKQSSVIDCLKGLLPILVVALHTSSSAGSLLCWERPECFIRVILFNLGKCAVPAFFLISGFLFFNGWDKFDIYFNKLKKRTKTLFVPYILWMIVDFFAIYAMDLVKGKAALGTDVLINRFVETGGIRMFYDRPMVSIESSAFGTPVCNSMPIDFPLWYIRDLMILMILAPVIYQYIKRTKLIGIFILFVLYLINLGLPVAGFSTSGFLFFSIGAYLSLNNKDFCQIFEKIGRWSYLASLVFMATSFALIDCPIKWISEVNTRILVICLVVAVFNIACSYVNAGHKPVKILTESSFFVYAVHTVLIMEIAKGLIWRAIPFTQMWVLSIRAFIWPVTTVFICILLYIGMKKFFPRTLMILTGGRG